jgi:MEMO1 family protein
VFDPTELARRAVAEWLIKGELLETPSGVPPEFLKPAAVFVSIKKGGRLRGCLGTFSPKRPSRIEEIIFVAIDAATQDPRFPALTADELPLLEFGVDVLNEPEPVIDHSDLDPKIFGIIVKSGTKLGLLLPDLKGVDSVEDQLAIARRKAGIEPTAEVECHRFTVTRYSAVRRESSPIKSW